MNSKTFKNPWALAIAINGCIAIFFSYALLSPAASIKTTLLPGKTTHGHYQMEMDCNACHTTGNSVSQDACLNCHAKELKASNDTHPASKFLDPANAGRLKDVDAQNCITCHREHVEDQTTTMGVTLPADYCFHCHQETLKTRPSHANFAFDSCATAGCHNYHDNRALYENFLLKHTGEADYLEDPRTLLLAKPESSSSTAKSLLDRAQADGPKESHTDEILDQWATTAHALGGVNCSGCHEVAIGTDASGDKKDDVKDASDDVKMPWSDKVSHQVCDTCHKNQTEGFLAGKHGMRLSRDLAPMTPGEARLPMHVDAAHQTLSCTACHDDHQFDTKHASVDACLKCHNDDHSNAFKSSSHFALFEKEMAGETAAGTGVTCATCHMPRMENPDGTVSVDHNQNNNLRPNEKMIRDVCMKCHGLAFSIDSLADFDLMKNCYSATPQKHIESIDMAKAWFDEKENKRLERINRSKKE